MGLLHAVVAAGICLFAGAFALAVTARMFRSQQALAGMLLAMGLRSIPPLTVCLILAVGGRPDRYLGFIVYLLGFYMAALAAETYASVRMVKFHNT